MPSKNINKLKSAEPQIVHTHRDNWEVMKPFVHFSVGAAKVIGVGLLAIVKGVLALKPGSHPERTNTIVKR